MESRLTAADEVFERLHRDLLTLTLLPGTRVSEAEVAAQFGVSRQPVREAFLRLTKLNFLQVRPQRPTIVRKISVAEVLNAKFIREALEIASAEVACMLDLTEWLPLLADNLSEQSQALESRDFHRFHTLDDAFHRMICDAAGRSFVWQLIAETKAHMDRARLLNLQFEAGLADAYADHLAILDALKAADPVAIKAALRLHLSRIAGALSHIRAQNADHFED